MTERMTKERFELCKVTADFGVARALYDELCEERNRFDRLVEDRAALQRMYDVAMEEYHATHGNT